MALQIVGPFPTNTSILVLPNPSLSNVNEAMASVNTIRMYDGSLRTFVKKRNQRKKFRWSFNVEHTKAKELEDFVIEAGGHKNTVYWDGDVIRGYLSLNPVDLRGTTDESFEITLEFEEDK